MVEVYHSLKIKRETKQALEDIKESYCNKHNLSKLGDDAIIRKALNFFREDLEASFWD